MSKYKTEQEEFWAGEFGDQYINRNSDKKILASKIVVFSKILEFCDGVKTILEFGPNVGLNIEALNLILPEARISAVEINKNAVIELKKLNTEEIFNESILEFATDARYDLTFTSGVLIHINPDELETVYEKLYTHSKKYILVAEYYNPVPVEIEYRGYSQKLFKRDFAGEIMEKYPDLKLVNYGMTYSKDRDFYHDDLNWFLMEK